MPSIVIADKADGTGFAATLAGFAAELVRVYAVPADGTAAWAAVASRTGPGAVDVPAAPGPWAVYAAPDAAPSSLTAPVLGYATDPAEAWATKCRRSVAAALAALAVPEIDGRYYEQLFPDLSNVRYPCCTLTVDGESERIADVVNTANDVGYPVRVVFHDNAHLVDHERLARYEQWREAVVTHFHQRRRDPLGILPGLMYHTAEPLTVADPSLPTYQHYASGLVVRSWVRH